MLDAAILGIVRQHAVSVDLDSAAQRLFEAIDPAASVVLVGKGTHRTQEFYRIRADLTRGLDLYSLHHSIDRVIEYLDKVDPAAAQRARQGYACFDAFGDDV